MPGALIPINEAERLAALYSYRILDTACEDSFDTIAWLAARLTASPIALVTLVDEHRQWFKARAGLEVSETHRDQAFCAHAILDPSQPMVVSDATKDARFANNALVTGSPNIRFYAGIPLVNPEGFALGTLCIIDRVPRMIDANTLDTLSGLAQSVVTTLELRRAMHRMQAMMLTDPLTGLPNRTAILKSLEQAIAIQNRRGEYFGLLYIDLDGFKSVNDVHGHDIGDTVLRVAADTIQSLVRIEDIAARVGGDEFAALVTITDMSTASRVGERIRAALQAAMKAGGWAVSASIGAVTFRVPPPSAREAMSAADAAMYAAKQAGKNCLRHFEYTGVDTTLAVA